MKIKDKCCLTIISVSLVVALLIQNHAIARTVSLTKLIFADIYAINTMPEVHVVPVIDSDINHPWKVTTYTPVTIANTTYKDFSHYINRPYQNPNILNQINLQRIKEKEQLQAQEKEHANKMQEFCANYYRATKFHSFHYEVHDLKHYPFNTFAQSCESYYKHQPLAWSGLGIDADHDLDDNSGFDHDLDSDRSLDDNTPYDTDFDDNSGFDHSLDADGSLNDTTPYDHDLDDKEFKNYLWKSE
ncbi:MAG: hypothetical protein AB1782_18585 [Cyanobacteriota bacterium]